MPDKLPVMKLTFRLDHPFWDSPYWKFIGQANQRLKTLKSDGDKIWFYGCDNDATSEE